MQQKGVIDFILSHTLKNQRGMAMSKLLKSRDYLGRKKIMNKSVRIIGLCVSFTVFVALLGLLASTYVAAQPEEVKCPCDFGSVQMTPGCWVEQFVNPIGPSWITTSILPKQKICALSTENFDVAFDLVLQVTHYDPHSAPRCMIEPNINNPAACR
jgi:hypothetical protein